jgi:hypothetical protein
VPVGRDQIQHIEMARDIAAASITCTAGTSRCPGHRGQRGHPAGA